ncbi:MAG: hypothetical protein LUF90_07470 [Rikenellaceae bacterium]|nr:hypothetical protein [Rikenellaceae bacterium]
MERKKYIRIRIILISLALLICGSSRSEYSERIYSAYITGDMNEWENVINEIEEQETLTIREKKNCWNIITAMSASCWEKEKTPVRKNI